MSEVQERVGRILRENGRYSLTHRFLKWDVNGVITACGWTYLGSDFYQGDDVPDSGLIEFGQLPGGLTDCADCFSRDNPYPRPEGGANELTTEVKRPKCDVATGTFTHSRDTATTPCGGEFKTYPVDLSGVEIQMVVCDEHIAHRVFNAKRLDR